MEKCIVFEVVANGKMDDCKAWFEARDQRLQELGFPRFKLYEVRSCTANMVCCVSPEVTPQEL